jgi:hypothetical protein
MAIRQWPFPGEIRLPENSGRAVAEPLKPVLTAERWDQGTWYTSPPKLSAANFQLQGADHLCTPPIISMPFSRRPKKLSRYQVISPRYSGKGGAAGSKVANIRPQ